MAEREKTRFVSLRWKVLGPLFVVILAAAMGSAYFLARQVRVDLAETQRNLLQESSRGINQRTVLSYERQRTEAQAIAFTAGVPQALADLDLEALQPILEGAAQRAGLDSIIVTDITGREVIGLQRVENADSAVPSYSLNMDMDLRSLSPVVMTLSGRSVGAAGMVNTAQGVMLYVAAPVFEGDMLLGVALVGQSLTRVLADVQSSDLADIVFYGAGRELLYTSFDPAVVPPQALILPETDYSELTQTGYALSRDLVMGEKPYQGLYFPFYYGENPLAVMGVILEDQAPAVSELARQVNGVTWALVAGAAVTAVFVILTRFLNRLEKVTKTAEALTLGTHTARTGLVATDEAGKVGQALDQYADYVKQRQDILRRDLRRHRRETAHLMAVLEALPDGVIVQDVDGRVLLMNEWARKLLGSHRRLRNLDFQNLTSGITDVLGPAIAPGVYTLGQPQQLKVDDKVLSAQVAAVTTATEYRIGTVIILRDISAEVRREQAFEQVLQQISAEVQQPLAQFAQFGPTNFVGAFGREISRHTVVLQRLLLELRDLNSGVQHDSVNPVQRPILLETLVWSVANEWRQVATANNLTLHVMIERRGLHVLGDERRLRWAMGNIVDNAIKYTPPGGDLTLEIRQELQAGKAVLRVRDNGVGMTREDRHQAAERFFRGTAVTEDGRVIQVPGTGQGLYLAQQIFEAHGGTMDVKSRQWVGTAVSFTIPVTASVSYQLPQLDEALLEGETVRIDPKIIQGQTRHPQ